MLGVRRANRQQTNLPSSVLSADSMHIGVLAAAAHAAANRSPFTIFYNPRYVWFVLFKPSLWFYLFWHLVWFHDCDVISTYLQGMSFRICCSFGQISKICIWNSTLSWYEVRNDVWNWWLGQTQVTFSPFFALWTVGHHRLVSRGHLIFGGLVFAFPFCLSGLFFISTLQQWSKGGVKPNHMKPCVQITWDWLCESFFALLPCPWPICWVVDLDQ